MNELNNAPIFSVSELGTAVKKSLESGFGRVRVRGELSGVKLHSSGHCYMDLKDDRAVLNSVAWRGTPLGIKPENGMEVICTGRLTTYMARSNYQMVIESMELAGEGALLKLLEDRKKRLAEEGLFDADRKRKIPYFPETIGVITSPTGAVIRDILHRIEDRCPRHVLVWPVAVQGAGASDQIATALHGFNTATGALKPDVIIVARGGGSLEDLMPFNEENVLRAAAAPTIPIISAVGHETDTTLIDYVSDRRAPTPTAAAEMAVPVRSDLIAGLSERQQRMVRFFRSMLEQKQNFIVQAGGRLKQVPGLVEFYLQKMDDMSFLLAQSPERSIKVHELHFQKAAMRLRFPVQQFPQALRHIEGVGGRLQRALDHFMTLESRKLASASALLESYSYKNVLKRGFALIYDEKGHAVPVADGLKSEARIRILMQDGEATATVSDVLRN